MQQETPTVSVSPCAVALTTAEPLPIPRLPPLAMALAPIASPLTCSGLSESSGTTKTSVLASTLEALGKIEDPIIASLTTSATAPKEESHSEDKSCCKDCYSGKVVSAVEGGCFLDQHSTKVSLSQHTGALPVTNCLPGCPQYGRPITPCPPGCLAVSTSKTATSEVQEIQTKVTENYSSEESSALLASPIVWSMPSELMLPSGALNCGGGTVAKSDNGNNLSAMASTTLQPSESAFLWTWPSSLNTPISTIPSTTEPTFISNVNNLPMVLSTTTPSSWEIVQRAAQDATVTSTPLNTIESSWSSSYDSSASAISSTHPTDVSLAVHMFDSLTAAAAAAAATPRSPATSFCPWQDCHLPLQTAEDILLHLLTTHYSDAQEEPPRCLWQGCQEPTLPMGTDLETHLRATHLPEVRIRCQWVGCTCGFCELAELCEHISEEHIGRGKAEYTCHWHGCGRCGRPFKQRQKALRHMQTHTGEKPYSCDICGRRFSESSLQQQHRRTHTGEKPYQCTECGREFSAVSALKIHMRTHTGEKPYQCRFEGCTKRFAESSNLTKHMRVHTGERPFVCQKTGCGKRFSRPDQLARHQRTHTGERPFLCPVEGCNQCFALAHTLKVHIFKKHA